MKPVAVLLSCLFASAIAASAFAAETGAAAASAVTGTPAGTPAAAAPAAPPASAAPAAATKPDLARGQAIASGVCVACHTIDGSRGIATNPILQGQHPEYLAKELADYKSGKRSNPIMNGMAAALSAEDMKNVAAFYASKEAKPGFATSKELAQLGEQLFRGGASNRSIPACAACHSPDGAGIPIQYPRLSGQHAEYTETQLQAFRSGARKNSVPMTGIAAYLTDREIKALSEYTAGLRSSGMPAPPSGPSIGPPALR